MFCYREIFGFCIQHDLLMPFMNSVVLRYFCWHRGGLGSYLVWVYVGCQSFRVLGFGAYTLQGSRLEFRCCYVLDYRVHSSGI